MMFNRLIKKIILFFSKFYYLLYKRENNLWVFGEWFGGRCCDNCMYFANYVSNHRPDIKIVWLSDQGVDTSRLSCRIIRTTIDSKEGISYLKHAGVVFMSHGMIDLTHKEIHYYSGALVVNLWHGSTPWKRIHFDTPMDYLHKSLMRAYTYLHEGKVYIVSSDRVFEIFKSAFDCKTKDIIKVGCPKNSVLYSKEFQERSRNELIKFCKRYNKLINDDVKIVTYLPTFRDKSQESFSFDKIQSEDLYDLLEEYNVILVQKLHYASSMSLDNFTHHKRIINLKDYFTQELLAASDILISDYSSCIFDYLVLDRPIIHYFYDYEAIKNNDRGLYFSKEEVICGDVAENIEELFQYLKLSLIETERRKEIRKKRKEEFLKYESPDSCEILMGRLMRKIARA